MVSLEGTHLGHNLPDKKGNRYCINLVSIAGNPKNWKFTLKILFANKYAIFYNNFYTNLILKIKKCSNFAIKIRKIYW